MDIRSTSKHISVLQNYLFSNNSNKLIQINIIFGLALTMDQNFNLTPTFLREEFAPFLRCQLLRKRHFESSKQGETNSRNGDATKTINPKKANPATT